MKTIITLCNDCQKPATDMIHLESWSIPICQDCKEKRKIKDNKERVRTVVLTRNIGLRPNLYDKVSTCNGCGNALVKKLGINADFIFYDDCLEHDFNYSAYKDISKEEADKRFLKSMEDTLDSRRSDLNFMEELFLDMLNNVYYELVENFGSGSYSEFNPSKPLPSTEPALRDKFRDNNIECVQILELITDNTYVWRWYTQSEAEILGLI